MKRKEKLFLYTDSGRFNLEIYAMSFRGALLKAKHMFGINGKCSRLHATVSASAHTLTYRTEHGFRFDIHSPN